MRKVLAAVCVCGFVTAVAVSLAPLHAADDADQLVLRVYPIADLPVWSIGGEQSRFDPSVLIAHIKSAVDPDSWTDGAIARHEETASLIVRQTKANHDKVYDVIRSLRQTKANHDKVADVIRSLRPKHPGEVEARIDGNDEALRD